MNDEATIRRLRRRLERAVEKESVKDVEIVLHGKSRSLANAAAAFKDGSNLLHVACSRGHGDIALSLLGHGVSASALDGDLNSPLHCAVKRLESHRSTKSWTTMTDIILALIWANASVYDAENGTGMSPRHMLQALLYRLSCKHKDNSKMKGALERFVSELHQATEPAKEVSEEADWQSKLMHEVMDDVDGVDGSEWRFFEDGYQFETLDDYMTRLGSAMGRRQRKERAHHEPNKERSKSDEPSAKRKKTLGPLKPAGVSRPSGVDHLAEDHDFQFLEMLRHSKEKDAVLFEYDIPWPCRGSAAEMAQVLVDGVPGDKLKLHVHKLLRRWHPDKFSQHLGGVLAKAHRDRILSRVTALAQALTAQLPCR